MSQLPADCLNEIVEYLEEDKITLFSCLLVSRNWCEASVRILWRSVRNCTTLIACLPNESKEILQKNKIIISTLISKHPLFNYVTFIKNLSIYNIDNIIKSILRNFQSITPQSLNHKKCIVAKEIYKLFMNQTTLKRLYFNSFEKIEIPNITFTSYPGTRDCLKNLSNFYCRSDIHPGFFNQLSQICHNIQYINITFENKISYGLTDLISVQKNLKCFIMRIYNCEDLTNLIHLLSKFSDTLIKYELNEQLFGGNYNMPLSFISKYTNLKELVLSFDIYSDSFKCFKNLEFVTFPQLEILEFPFIHPRIEELIKFLENNGKNLVFIVLMIHYIWL